MEGPSCVHLQDPAQLRRITQAVTSTRYCAVLILYRTALIVLYTRSPVLVEFSLYPHLPPGARLGLVLYVGMMPSYKISVRYQTKHNRIAIAFCLSRIKHCLHKLDFMTSATR